MKTLGKGLSWYNQGNSAKNPFCVLVISEFALKLVNFHFLKKNKSSVNICKCPSVKPPENVGAVLNIWSFEAETFPLEGKQIKNRGTGPKYRSGRPENEKIFGITCIFLPYFKGWLTSCNEVTNSYKNKKGHVKLIQI